MSTSAMETGSSGAAKLSGLRRQVREVQAERRQHAGAPDPHGSEPTAPSPPPATSGDSGGGSGQFRTQGDNSIQEFGHEASGPERESAAAALHAYLDARVAHRWKSACFYMSAGVVVTLKRLTELSRKGPADAGCPELFAALSGGANPKAIARSAQVDVGSLRVKGGRAFVLYHGPEGAGYAMPMAREAAEWKVGTLEGIPLP